MQVKETLNEGLKRQFNVTVPASDMTKRADKRLNELAARMKLPGFRPGKIPMDLVKKRYGDSVQAEIIQKAASETAHQLLQERGLKIAIQPKVEILKSGEAKDLEFNVDVELLPDIHITDFKKLSFEKITSDIPEEKIDETLSILADRQRPWVKLEQSRMTQKGDGLIIDFVGKKDGKEFPGGKADNYRLELGSNTFIPGFEDQLTGVMVPSQKNIEVTFPENYGSANLAGQKAVFEINLKEIEVKGEKPAFDDEFAKKMGYQNISLLKDAIKKQLEEEIALQSKDELKRKLFDQLYALHDFDLPKSVVDQEFNQIWQGLEQNRKSGQLDPEDQNKTDDELRKEYRKIAERRVKLGLLLSEVGRIHNIQISNDELNQAVMGQARRFPGQERQVFDYYRNNQEALAQLRAPLYEDKIVDFILDMVTVTSHKVPYNEVKSKTETKGISG
ncbi:MAG: trigger factor [Alphaproteobacteria bacterium]|nr:trigger factor [Alphaproteobacteria bacterium]